MQTVTINKGFYRGSEFSGTFEYSHSWFPSDLPAHEKTLGDGKVVIFLEGKRRGIWVFKSDITIHGTAPINSTNVFNIPEPEIVETKEEMKERINKRFAVMDMITQGVIKKTIRSLIISGAPGIGKTFSLNRELRAAEERGEIEYTLLNGKMSPLVLYCKLFENSGPNSILVLDDVDVFSSEDSLNILKAALDTSDERKVCWSTASSYLETQNVPNEFIFEGTVIFITNMDFDRELNRGSKLTPHLDALVSRSIYLDLGVHSNEEIMVRVEDIVLNTDMLFKVGLLESQVQEVLNWMLTNVSKLRNISLRTALSIAEFVITDSNNWEIMAEITLLRKI